MTNHMEDAILRAGTAREVRIARPSYRARLLAWGQLLLELQGEAENLGMHHDAKYQGHCDRLAVVFSHINDALEEYDARKAS